jgi:formate dehydrogenase subunit gamma
VNWRKRHECAALPERIERYGAATRINHWTVAISFVLLALSGLALFHPALFWLTNLFGGGPWTRILHPFIGCFMVAAFLLLSVKTVARQHAAAARLDMAAQDRRRRE